MKSLEPEILEASKYWLKHVFFPFAGRGSVKACEIRDKIGFYIDDTSEISIACKELYAEITDRQWKDLDATLAKLSKYSFECSKLEGRVKNTLINMSVKFVTEALAWMCRVNEIEWNDLTHTKYELEYFKKTDLGKALWGFECFLSQYMKNTSAPIQSTKNQTNTASAKTAKNTATSKTNGGTNSWKARGPLSSQVRDIVSIPGNKEYVQTNMVYTIDDIYATGKKTRAFIRPLKPTGAINGTNKVYIGNSNNYEDCTCYFDSKVEAKEFLDKIEAAGTYNGTLNIENNKVDKNGYFVVNTELGKCLIRAFNLNEEVEEVLDEDLEFSFEDKAKHAFDKFYSFLD